VVYQRPEARGALGEAAPDVASLIWTTLAAAVNQGSVPRSLC